MKINKNAIFLTNPNSLNSYVTGGVQLCSQEIRISIDSLLFNYLENHKPQSLYLDVIK
jgi:hypothetical protein